MQRSSHCSAAASAADADEDEARRAAIALAKSLCQSGDSLQRLATSKAQLQEKASEASAKLRTFVQTQVDATRWALQLLEQSAGHVASVRDSLRDIWRMCQQCRELVPDYQHIRAVALARRHLRHTVRLLSMFRAIPERARLLEHKVLNQDAELFRVYVEVRQLVHLRDQAFEQSKEYDAHGLKQRVRHHFDSLQAVTDALFTRVWQNLGDCFDLAEEDPATLVKTLQIVEVEDLSAEFALFKKSRDQGENMMEIAKQRLEESVGVRFAQAFEDDALQESRSGHGEENADDKDSEMTKGLSHVLQTGTQLIDDLSFVANHVAPCFPPRFDIFRFYETRYQKWLYTRLLHSTSELEKLSLTNLLDSVRWIQGYRTKMSELGADLSQASLLEQHAVLLMQAYLERAEAKLCDWASNAVQIEWRSDPVEEDTGHWVTSSPQDVFSSLNGQIDIGIRRGLKGQSFFEFAELCANVLTHYQGLVIAALNAQGIQKEDTFLSAIINNCQQCSDNTESLRDRCLERLNEEQREELEEKIDEVLSGFVRVGSVAIGVIVSQMMNCIFEKIMVQLFKKEWMTAPDGDFADQMIVTLQDYFQDYEVWISSEFFFAKLIKDAIHALVTAYINTFVTSGIDASKDGVLDKLRADYVLLRDFFISNVITEYVPTRQVETEIENIEKILSILDCEVGWIPLYFETVFELYGADKGQALKSLLAMRSDLNWQEKSEILERYKEKYSDAAAASQAADHEIKSNLMSPERISGNRSGGKRTVLSNMWKRINKGRKEEDELEVQDS